MRRTLYRTKLLPSSLSRISRRTNNSQRISNIPLRIESLEARRLLASDFGLLKDINTRPQLTRFSDFPAAELTVVGRNIFFSYKNDRFGSELWKTDSTAGGTRLVRDTVVGVVGSDPRNLTRINDLLFYTADDGEHGRELWKSDGTAAGTQLVKDIALGSAASNPSNFVHFAGMLYFTATGPDGTGLWRTDGTESGTTQLTGINPVGSTAYPTSLTPSGSTLFFFNYDPSRRMYELWKTDGTNAGTTRIKSNLDTAKNAFAHNGILYFSAGRRPEPWKSDGTALGTALLKEIRQGINGSYPEHFTVLGADVYFTAHDGTSAGLWKTDGTTNGTSLVTYISDSDIFGIVAVGSNLFIDTRGSLERSDGSPEGTFRIKTKTGNDLFATEGDHLMGFAGSAYFTGYSPSTGWELWKSDGTVAGTQLLKDIYPGTAGAFPRSLAVYRGTLIFSASLGARLQGLSESLWKTDGTSAGTTAITALSGNGGGVLLDAPNYLGEMVNVNGTLFFDANNGTQGRELWKSNGTAEGTSQVKDIFPGATSSELRELTSMNGSVYFIASSDSNSRELWKSDGTPLGTIKLTSNSTGPYFTILATTNNRLFYLRADARGQALWVTDGTVAGTTRLKNMDVIDSYTAAEVNGQVYFTRSGTGSVREIWRTNGTVAGTVFVAQINFATGLTAVGASLFYFDSLGASDALWKAGPTGKTLVKANVPFGRERVSLNGRFVFSVYAAPLNQSLMISDGTAAGTFALANNAAPFRDANQLTVVNGILYFIANGNELWKSDGTRRGTVRVSPVGLFSLTSPPKNLSNAGGQLFFTANDGVNGEELWTSDGTAAGTVMVKNFAAGGSNPGPVIAINNLRFVAATTLLGREIFVANFSSANALTGTHTMLAAPIQVAASARGDTEPNPIHDRPPLMPTAQATVKSRPEFLTTNAGFAGYRYEAYVIDNGDVVAAEADSDSTRLAVDCVDCIMTDLRIMEELCATSAFA